MNKSSQRPLRPAAVKAANIFNNGAGHCGSGSDDEEEAYGGNRAVQRSARRLTKVDLGKLNPEALQRYRQKFGLKEGSSRDDLLIAVMKHFANSNVDEEETILRFAQAVHRAGAARMASNGGIKKQRPAPMKPKGR